MPGPALIVHGGAWNIPDSLVRPCREGAAHALDVGWERLSEGGTALDAVCAAVCAMEDAPAFNAGTGSTLNEAGEIEMDASVMVGDDLRAGAVAAIRHVRHPVSVARRVMEATEHVLLAGDGALEFAVEQGFERLEDGALVLRREQRDHLLRSGDDRWTTRIPFEPGEGPGDTVGAVAVDARGAVAAATSTGGTPRKRKGRVGDSPLIGSGTYATEAGAASCTGWGEVIIRVVMAFQAVAVLEGGGSPDEAARAAVAALERVPQGRAGVIVADRDGRIGLAFSTPRMAYAWRTADGREGAGPS